jgi:hypothetical protein
MANILRYTGINRRGTSAVGAVDGHANTPAFLAQQLYDKGWRQATITRDGEEVGGIGRLYGSPREWWGECTT